MLDRKLEQQEQRKRMEVEAIKEEEEEGGRGRRGDLQSNTFDGVRALTTNEV